MDANSRVILYGNSMFLAGIKAELEQRTSLELITVEARYHDAAVLIDSCDPCVVLFDLATQHPAFALALLRERPGLLLIGVDPSHDELLLFSSQPVEALSISDLVEVINKEISIAAGTNNTDIRPPSAVDSPR